MNTNDALEALDKAQAALREASKIASARLRVIWNPDTRKYEPHEEMVALHDIINKNLSVYCQISDARQALKEANHDQDLARSQ